MASPETTTMLSPSEQTRKKPGKKHAQQPKTVVYRKVAKDSPPASLDPSPAPAPVSIPAAVPEKPKEEAQTAATPPPKESAAEIPLAPVQLPASKATTAETEPDSKLREQIREQSVLYSLLEAKMRAVNEQLEKANRARKEIEAECPKLETELQEKTKLVPSLMEESAAAARRIQELSVKLQNRETVCGRLEADSAELARFARSKDNEIAAASTKVWTEDEVQTDSFGTEGEKPAKEKLKTRIMEKTNAMISEKEKVLQELEGRVKEIVREKTRLAEQLEELKRVIRRLQLGSVVRRKHKEGETIKDELFEKNQMEIRLEESHINAGLYKMLTFVIASLLIFVILFSVTGRGHH